MTQNWPSSFSFQMMSFPSSSTTTTATAVAPSQQNSWVDEFLDFSSARRNSHRRSVSDPIAFIEAPNLLEQCRTSSNNNNNGFEKLDDEQVRNMFSDDVSGMVPLPTMSSSNLSTPSDQNSESDEKNNIGPAEQNLKPKTEPGEVIDSSSKPQFQTQPSSNNPSSNLSPDNSIVDPKRIKRILANRQSAQRSRVRKLQYISELERSVTTLQTEVSALSPRVAFLDQQRLILNVDNSTLKQRIAALAQDQIFKDAHQEALRKEIERLRQIYHQQNMKKMANKGTNEKTHQPQPVPLSNFNKNGNTDQE